MRIDVVSIFVDYLAPLELSLIGQARRKGLLDVRVHDLRDFTHDRHRTVDDTPYGGGAGMVMRPEPWGEALDAIHSSTEEPSDLGRPRLLVPTPSGTRFTQELAAELAAEDWLVFACGRYEGIDERVLEEAGENYEVTPVSLGDYVLNGGEVAVLAIVEAVARLVPGVIGNPESLVEESHEDGLLEYPVYTKPASWRGREVPEVLLGGNHGEIARWRHEQRLSRTSARRPDLIVAQPLDERAISWPEGELRPATLNDVAEIYTLTRACWLSEAIVNDRFDIPALHETLDDQRAEFELWQTWVLRNTDPLQPGRLIGSARGRISPDDPKTWEVGRVMVAPDLQGHGLGKRLLSFIHDQAPKKVRAFELVTGRASERNLGLYGGAGYRIVGDGPPGAAKLRKDR